MENSEISILLVDDEPDILEFLGYNLEKEGYKVLKAKNGRLAVKTAIEQKPQLVILDVMMPVMDGIEACTEIRKIPELAGTLIAFLTARGEDYSQIAGFDAGADDVFITPIIMKKLRPANKLTVLCSKKILSEVKALIFRHSTSIGLREYPVIKTVLDRDVKEIETELGRVRIKSSSFEGKEVNCKPEYEDLKKLAEIHNLSLKEVEEKINKMQ